MSVHAERDVRFGSMTITSPLSGTMINKIKWNLHAHNESIIHRLIITSSKRK